MQWKKYASNLALYTALFSLLITTPVPAVVQATEIPTSSGTEQQDKQLTIQSVRLQNDEFIQQVEALQEAVSSKAQLLCEEGSHKEKDYTIIYSDYSAFKTILFDAQDAIYAGNKFTNGDTDENGIYTPGSTHQLNILESNPPESNEELNQQLTTLSAAITEKKKIIDRHLETVISAGYTTLTLEVNTTILTNNTSRLESVTNDKRSAITPSGHSNPEEMYTPSSYAIYKNAIDASDKQIQSAKDVINKIKQALDREGYASKAETHTLSEEDMAAIKLLTEEVSEQLKDVATAIDNIHTLDSSILVKCPSKTDLKKQIDAAKNYPPDIYTTYTAETYAVFQKCLEDARRVYNDPDATGKEIKSATSALKSAIKNLEEVDRAYLVAGNTYYYNVNAFGAFGSDTIDDTAALQKALDQARPGVNIVITFPAGTYYIDNTLYIQSNTTLNLDANAIVYRSNDGLGKNILKNSDSKHKTTGYGEYSLSENITINGGIWDGGNINHSTKTCNLVYIGHASNIRILNTTIRNCHGSHALEFAGVQNSVVRNCTFTGFRYGSDKYTSEAIQFDICYKSSSTDWTPGFDMDKTVCRNITVENCNITDYPRGVGTHHVLSGIRYENITIRNNTITRSSISTQGKCVVGIFVLGARDLTVTGNTVNGYSYGAMIKQSSGLSVKKNTFKNNDSYNLVYEGNSVANKYVRFTLTKYKTGTKPLTFTAPTIRTGKMKTRGQTYKIKKVKNSHSVKLKKKLKKKQKITFYGKDKNHNKFYRTYYIGK